MNTWTSNTQDHAKISALSGGGFIATYCSIGIDGDSYGIAGQLFDSTGNKVGAEFVVNTTTVGQQAGAAVTTLSNGNFVVSWQSQSQSHMSGQIFNASGGKIGTEFQIDNYSSNSQSFTDVSALSDGGFVVTWDSYAQDGSGGGIYGQRYDASGNKRGSQFQVNTFVTSDQIFPAVKGLSNGGFVVTWESNSQDGSGYGIF